jgi:hypothetical protein
MFWESYVKTFGASIVEKRQDAPGQVGESLDGMGGQSRQNVGGRRCNEEE